MQVLMGFFCVTLHTGALRTVHISRRFCSQTARVTSSLGSLAKRGMKPCQGQGSSAGTPPLTRSEEGHNELREQQGWSHPTQPSPFRVLCVED